jgi:biopolymer transport protein ExbD
MAELNTGDDGGKKGGGKVRSKKQNSKVDLTAMVDLAFLLITFFMLTTTLSKPSVMPLAMPDKTTKDNQNIAQERVVTLLLGPENKLKTYHGTFDGTKATYDGPKDITYGKNGVRKELLAKIKKIPELMGNEMVVDTLKGSKTFGKSIPKYPIVVLIKASKKSTYKNLISVLDEMKICGVGIYAVVDIDKNEDELFNK